MKSADSKKSQPRLPHEHDQSIDAQGSQAASHRETGRKALSDIAAGREDTDRGPVMDKAYREQKKRSGRSRQGKAYSK